MAEKVKISIAEFDKRVDMETASLMYFDRMKKDDAVENAKRYISSKYIRDSK